MKNDSTKERLKELASGKLGALLLKYSWPALLAMTLNALYSVVDGIFIGKGCGTEAMAGLQLVMPVMMLMTAFGPLIGVGHAALLSIKLGEGDRESCERLVGETIALKLLLYLLLIPVFYCFLDSVLYCCGANKVTGEAYAMARTYLKIVLASHIFSHLAFGLSALQRAEGAAIRSMMCMVVGFGANLILDPLLIFGFDFPLFGRRLSLAPMGIAGAGWATDIAMFLSALYAFSSYWTRRTVVRLRWRKVRLYGDLLGRALKIGLAPFLQQLMGAVVINSMQVAFTLHIVEPAGCTAEIASLGVYTRALMFVIMPILGCQQGLQPILGYNWGARNYRRVFGTLKLGLWVTTLLTVLAFVVQVVPPFPTWVARLFVEAGDTATIELAAHDLIVANCLIWCISLNIVMTTYYQSIGHPWTAVFLSFLRQGVVMMPIIWILPYFMADKPLAIWLCQPISDILCCLATILPFLLTVRFLTRVRDRNPGEACDLPREVKGLN